MPNVFAASVATLFLGLLPLGQSWAANPVAMNPVAVPLRYEAGRVNAEAQINPLTRRLLSRALKKEVPSEVEFSATNLAGQVAMPPGQTEFLDGAIAIDATPLRRILSPAFDRALAAATKAYNLPQGLTPTQLEMMFQYRFVGEGTLSVVDESVNPSLLMGIESKDSVSKDSGSTKPVSTDSGSTKPASPQTTRFVFKYDDQTGAISAEGLDPEVWNACRTQTCSTSMDGTFDVDLHIDGALEVSEALKVRLPSSVKRVLRNALFWGVERLDFASGTMTSDLMTLPQEEALELANSPVSQELKPVASVRGEAIPMPKTAPPGAAAASSHSNPSAPYFVALTHGDFVLTSQGSTVPWSAVFSVP